MKKGVIGSVIGFLFFFFAFGIVTFEGGFEAIYIILPFLFFVGIVFFITSALKNSKRLQNKTDTHYSNSQSTMTQCRSCHSSIEKAANYCPVCGASQDSTIKCEYCGHVNPSSNALCEKCNGFL